MVQEKLYTEKLPWGVLVVDPEGRIVSEEGVIRQYLPDLSGRHLSELKELERIWRSLPELRKNPFQGEIRYLRLKDRYYKTVILPTSETGEDIFYNIYFFDITELYEVERELTKRNRQLITLNNMITSFIDAQDSNPYNILLQRLLELEEFDGGLILIKKDNGFHVLAREGVTFLSEDIKGEWFKELLPKNRMAMTILEKEDILEYKALMKERFEFFAVIPLKMHNAIEGWLCLGKRAPLEVDLSLVTFLNSLGSNISILIEKQHLYEETKRLSLTDPLTGLYNIRYFYETLEKEIKRASRYGEVFSVVIFDIDDFKKINDTFGHQAGDDVLREVAKIILQNSRGADTVARYGGEEFAMLLPRTDRDSASHLAERIKDGIHTEKFCKDTLSMNGKIKGIKITISGGIATFPHDATDSRTILYRADMALYKAKALGKARIVGWEGGGNETGV